MFRAYNLWVTSPPTETPPTALIEAATVIEANLDDSLQGSTLPSHLYDAAHYAVVNGGKRVRPALTLLCRVFFTTVESPMKVAYVFQANANVFPCFDQSI